MVRVSLSCCASERANDPHAPAATAGKKLYRILYNSGIPVYYSMYLYVLMKANRRCRVRSQGRIDANRCQDPMMRVCRPPAWIQPLQPPAAHWPTAALPRQPARQQLWGAPSPVNRDRFQGSRVTRCYKTTTLALTLPTRLSLLTLPRLVIIPYSLPSTSTHHHSPHSPSIAHALNVQVIPLVEYNQHHPPR